MAFPPIEPFAIPATHTVPVFASELSGSPIARCAPCGRARTTIDKPASTGHGSDPDTPRRSCTRHNRPRSVQACAQRAGPPPPAPPRDPSAERDSLPGRGPGVSAMPSLRNDPTLGTPPACGKCSQHRVLTRRPQPGSDRSELIRRVHRGDHVRREPTRGAARPQGRVVHEACFARHPRIEPTIDLAAHSARVDTDHPIGVS
jgi:hypothetical protein